MKININNAEFIKSAASRHDIPADTLPRVVFVGKSNVGKSSLINALLGRKKMAKVSSSPGKTIFVNFFSIDKKVWLVDLPGYGYSKTSHTERERYSRLINDYLNCDFANIRRFYMIVDIRHKPTAADETMMEWLKAANVPITLIANKCDKLKKSELEPCLDIIRNTLSPPENTLLLPFSALKLTNRDALIQDFINAAGYGEPE